MNTIPSALRRSLILKSAMEEFKHKLIPLGLFSTVLRNVSLEGNNEIDIPYIPLARAGARILTERISSTRAICSRAKSR